MLRRTLVSAPRADKRPARSPATGASARGATEQRQLQRQGGVAGQRLALRQQAEQQAAGGPGRADAASGTA